MSVDKTISVEMLVLKSREEQLKTVFDGVPYLQTKHYFIERADVEADINYLMNAGQEFWCYVKSGKKPPLMLPEF